MFVVLAHAKGQYGILRGFGIAGDVYDGRERRETRAYRRTLREMECGSLTGSMDG